MKDEKELKPVSMRVRDAAENLLALILEQVCIFSVDDRNLIQMFQKIIIHSQVGGFPSTCGSASLGSLLDEHTLARHCTPSIKNPIHRYGLLIQFFF